MSETNQVTAKVLADWLGVSDRRVQQLAKAEIVKKSVTPNRYELVESVQGYCEWLRKQAQGKTKNSDAQSDVKTRIDQLRERKLAVEVAELERKVISSVAVVAAWTSITSLLRGSMLGIVSEIAADVRLAVQDGDTDKTLAIVKKAVESALKHLAQNVDYAESLSTDIMRSDQDSTSDTDAA